MLTALEAPMADFARPAAAATTAAAAALAPECGVQVNQNVWHRKMSCLEYIGSPQKTERAMRLCPEI